MNLPLRSLLQMKLVKRDRIGPQDGYSLKYVFSHHFFLTPATQQHNSTCRNVEDIFIKQPLKNENSKTSPLQNTHAYKSKEKVIGPKKCLLSVSIMKNLDNHLKTHSIPRCLFVSSFGNIYLLVQYTGLKACKMMQQEEFVKTPYSNLHYEFRK